MEDEKERQMIQATIQKQMGTKARNRYGATDSGGSGSGLVLP